MGSGIDIAKIKNNIENIALSVLNEKKDIADIVLVERSASGIKTEYIFAAKILHDDELSEKVYFAFLDNYCKTATLHPYKTQVIVENNTVKELFFLKYKDRI